MQCENCGRPLLAHDAICPLCGEPVARDTATLDPAPARAGARPGTPADPSAPTVFAPPAAWPGVRAGHRPVHAPPATTRRRAWLRAAAVLCIFSLAVLFVAGTVLAARQRLDASGRGPGATAPATSARAAACPLPAVDPQAARAFTQVQLTTGLRDAQLDPADDVTAFVVGQHVFLTAAIATDQAGTIGSRLCSNGHVLDGLPQSVPAGATDDHLRYAFPSAADSPALTPADVGAGCVVLTWNGAVAAAVPFTVAAP